MRKQKTFSSKFYCVFCGQEGIPLARKLSKSKQCGHLKKLYCIHCKKQTNHVEIRPFGEYTYEDFLFEFNNNNFDEEGLRILESEKILNIKGE